MMMIVLHLRSFLGLKSPWNRHFSPRPLNKGVFSGGGESADSWTPGPKPLCHRHPTGPLPSGLLWTPAKGRFDEKHLCASAGSVSLRPSVILSEAKDPIAIASGMLVERPWGPSLRSGRQVLFEKPDSGKRRCSSAC